MEVPLSEGIPDEFSAAKPEIAKVQARPTAVDIVGLKTIKGLVGCIPVVGAFLQCVVFEVPEQLASERMARFIEDLEKRVEDLGCDVNRLAERLELLTNERDSDDIAFLFFQVARCPYNEHRPLYVEALFKLANKTKDEADLSRTFVLIVNSLNPLQAKMVKSFVGYHYWALHKTSLGESSDVWRIDWNDAAKIQQKFGSDATTVKAMADDLIAKGLLIDDGPGRLSTSADRSFLKPTALAVKFIDFVLPESEVAAIKLAQQNAIKRPAPK